MKKIIIVLMVALLIVPGCGNMNQTTKGGLLGGGAGAAVGAGLGALIGKGKGAAIGAAIGSAVGAGAGVIIGRDNGLVEFALPWFEEFALNQE